MAWTRPKTDWATGELVVVGDMNTVGENLAALKHPLTATHTTTEAINAMRVADFIDVDSDNLNLKITTTGGDVMVHFTGSLLSTSHGDISCDFDIHVDGNRMGGDKGMLRNRIPGQYIAVNFSCLIENLSAGAHTFKLQWKTGADSAVRLFPGAYFWVREIS